MTRPLVWLAACLALLLAGVAWISVTVLRLEAAEARARRQAAVEEGARLALWRLDSNVAPLLQRESSQQPRGYTQIGLDGDELILLRFEIGPDGRVRGGGDPERCKELEGEVSREALVGALGSWAQLETPPVLSDSLAAALTQATRSSNEFAKRNRAIAQAQNAAPTFLPEARELRREAMRPVWVGGELLLIRRVLVDGEDLVQGAWIDWPALRRTLLRDIADLFPAAGLEPTASRDRGERLLASLPVRLQPGEPATVVASSGAPVTLVLGGAWAAVLVAAAAMVVLLAGTVALSERRAAFVSAVTHELRTPLTTLRTYTEMLAGGMVREEKRAGYLATLQREAERLARLVDNVLLYARLERGRRGRAKLEDLRWHDLTAAIGPRLEERAAASDRVVSVDGPEDLVLRADPVALEQILFNLVDNACKYGAGEIRVRARDDGTIDVSDDGDGIAAEDRRFLFEPFARSAERAAGSAPGVGLGLALCRRLARAMGGDLVLEPGPGARFAVRLRRA